MQEIGPEGCCYNYVVSAHKPTNVQHSAVGHFTSPTDLNLILAKSTRLEIHSLTPDGLQGVLDVPIYGRIAALKLFRPRCEPCALLFLLTERYKFCVLAYDQASGELVTRAAGDASDAVGRPAEAGMIAVLDPACRMIGLHLYDGLFKVIPLDERGQLQEAFNVRLEELRVVDLAVLEGGGGGAAAGPVLAVLFEDTKEQRHVKTYTVSLREKELTDGPWAQSNLDSGTSLLIPVRGSQAGAVVVGESYVMYLEGGSVVKSAGIAPTLVRAYGSVDEEGGRYLLGDHMGNLSLMVLVWEGGRVVSVKVEPLGRTSQASTLAYLDSGVVFVGSSFGDSQLIRLHPTPPDPADPANFVEVVDTVTNLGPIVDFCVVDLERQGQGQAVTCSGAGVDGSLRIIRNGIGVIEQAAVELPGIKGVWSLRSTYMDAYDTYLVLTFVGETRVLGINTEEELDEADIAGFDANAQTLYCGNTVHDQLVQVTPSTVRLVDCMTRQLVTEWRPRAGASISVAAGSPSQVVLASGGGHLVYLEVGEGSLTEAGHAQLDAEIACLDVTPAGEEEERGEAVAVGTWALGLHVFALPGLRQVTSEVVGGEVIPRSVLFARLEGVTYLLCGLGDGHLLTWRVEGEGLAERKKLALGTKPVTLRTFKSRGTSHVFAASDRPTIIYSSSRKLLYSNLNENEVNFMASFNTASFPDSLAIAKEETLTIGNIDEIQKLHIRTVPLHEQPRRIAHQDSTRSYAVTTTKATFVGGLAADDATDVVRLLDDQTFETLDRYPLGACELANSIASMTLSNDPALYYVVGTAIAVPEEPEPTKGRLLVFSAVDSKLSLVSEKETRGGVYNVLAFQGMLLAGINSRVQLYRWQQHDNGSWQLVPEASHAGHVLALYIDTRGDFIVVGDLMKSLQLLMYKAEEGILEVRARDFNANWMTAAAILDDDTYIGGENDYNLFVVRKNSDAATDEERARLEVVGQYHLGEFVNRFRHGSLVMKLPDSELSHIPTLLYGTINGVIGVIASLPQQLYAFLETLQEAMRRVVQGVGGFDHAQWRAFTNPQRTEPAKNFIDGDLIEQFLDLRRDCMESVVQQMGGGATLEEVMRVVEELSRIH